MTGGCVPVYPRDGVVQISDRHAKRLIQNNTAAVCPKHDRRPFLLNIRRNTDETGKTRRDILRRSIGSEQGGFRPVLVLQNDKGNQYSPTTIVAAVTSKREKAGLPTHVKITIDGLKTPSIVLLEQLRTIDKTRLGDYAGKLNKDTMGKVDHTLITSLGVKCMEVLL